jgi:hypothetical protein
MTGRRFLIPWSLLLCFLAGSPAGAEDRPLLRVGQVRAVDGTLAVRPAGGEWTDSAVNDPIMAGMSVRTAPQGRAALRTGAETIALAPATELDVAQLDASGIQLVLHRGRIGVRLSPLDPALSIEVDIPRGGVWLLTPGDYDITAGDASTPARIAVFDGRARVVGKRLDTAIATGSASVLSGADPVVASLDGAAADDFVAWWRPAGGADPDPPALRYVSAEMTGYDSLDGYGTWETVKGYGAVWFPQRVPDDWAPYRDGHWRWIAPWGWSWIDDMPWGFAPSHYGRWARIAQADPAEPSAPLDLSDADLRDGPPDGPRAPATPEARWGWLPGRLVAHPVYAPALVAFLGTAGVGLSYPDSSGPAVAWFALAPGEVYWPGYTSGLDMIRRINQGAVVDVSAIGSGANSGPPAAVVDGDYRNRRFASVVPRPVFIGGRPVAPALIQLPGERLDDAPLLAGSPQIAPAPPRPVAVATAVGPRWARAMQTLARILAPRGRTRAARAAILVHPAHARLAALALVGHSRWPGARLVRPRLIAAVASRTSHLRLHFAAAHRATLR